MTKQNYPRKGTFVLSLDVELAWGAIDKPNSLLKNKEFYENTRYVIREMLILMEKYEIQSTWAIVGQLFLDKDEVKDNDTFESHIKIRNNGELNEESYKKINLDHMWYGKDIVDCILNCDIKQEIASHSYSHIIFGDNMVTDNIANLELSRVVEVAAKRDIKIDSFIFPRNSIGHISQLKNHGIRSFRGRGLLWYERYPRVIRKLCHIIDQIFAITPEVNKIFEKQGLIDIPGSMLYLSRDGFRKYIPISARVNKAKKGIQRAIEDKKVFHLWFHPFNIATDPEGLLYGLEEIFKEVSIQRSKGNLLVKTMNQIVDEYFEYSEHTNGN